ncbi:MAG: hypothetical protein ABFD64_03370 [Armatimonadota bacterium]
MKFLMNLQNIDRRVMYILLVVVVAVPLYLKWKQPIAVTQEVKSLYNTVEKIKSDRAEDGVYKVGIISVSWGAGTLAENRSQTEAVARHLFKDGIPLILLPWDQQGNTIATDSIKRIAKEMGKKYGKDWISTGWRPGGQMAQIIQSMPRGVCDALGKDMYGTPLKDIPMMKGVNDCKNIGIVFEVTGSGTVGIWISFLGQTNKVPIAYLPTAVNGPEGYNMLDAGQICGLMPGLIGAAKYETQLAKDNPDLKTTDTFALRGANALSTSHLMIIVLIILGNIGYFMSQHRRQVM